MESVHQAKVVHTQIRNPLPLYQKEPNKLSISTTSFLAKASLNNQFTPPPQPPPLLLFFCALRLPRFYGGLTAWALEALILGDPSASRGEETRPWGERGASEGTPSTLPKRTPLPSPPARLPGASHPPAPSRVPSEQPSLLLPGLSGCGRPGPRGAGPTAPHPRSRALRRVCGGAGRSERGRGGPTHHGGGGEDAGGGVGPRNGRHLQVLLPEGLVRHLSASRAASASATPLRLRASPTAAHRPPTPPTANPRRNQSASATPGLSRCSLIGRAARAAAGSPRFPRLRGLERLMIGRRLCPRGH